jgi:hypothetical protein
MAALFSPGHVVATSGALTAFASAGIDPLDLLVRHVAGDWGEVPPEDAAENLFSVQHGFRIMSSYTLSTNERIWNITENDRSLTTLLLPSEY